MGIAQLIVALAPTCVSLVENIFAKGKKSGGQKAALALNIAQTAIVAALGIEPGAFGQAEQTLVTAINNDMVAYYNAKGWPTTIAVPPTVPAAPAPVAPTA